MVGKTQIAGQTIRCCGSWGSHRRDGDGRYRGHGSPGGPERWVGARDQARGNSCPRLGRRGAQAHRATTGCDTGRSPSVTRPNPALELMMSFRVQHPSRIAQITGRRAGRGVVAALQSAPAERDQFVSHLDQSRREYRRACETAGKSDKQIERCVIARVSGSPRAWALRASSGSWRSCCELGTDSCLFRT